MIPFRTGLATLGHERGRRWFGTPGYWVTGDTVTYVENMNNQPGTSASIRLNLTLP